MKNFYLFLAAGLLATAANAQVINFAQNGVNIPNESTITLIGGEESPSGNITFDPKIDIVSNEDVTVNVRAICTTKQIIQMCAGGQCETGTSILKENVKLTASTPLATQFEYIYSPDDPKPEESVVTKLFVDLASNPGDPVAEITVMFDFDTASVSAISTGSDVFYTGNELKYNVELPCEAMIYDASGKLIYKAQINGTGSISTDNLTPGAYIFNIGNANGKFIVR